MNKIRQFIVLMMLLSLSIGALMAQGKLGVEAEVEQNREARIEAKNKKAEVEFSYIPSVFGAVKVKFETTLYDGKNRFTVRNTRVGFKGNVSKNMNYMVQVDFNNEGKISVLDAYAAYAKGHFEFSLGQQPFHFSSDLTRGPNANIFANRSLLAKYIVNYHGMQSEGEGVKQVVGSIGSRDMGAVVHYRIFKFPLKLTLGAYSGNGGNNPQWRNTMNVVGRIEYGSGMGLGVAASHYNGYSPLTTSVIYNPVDDKFDKTDSYKQRMRMWDFEMSYKTKDFWIQAEYAQRRLQENGLQLLSAGHIQSYYQFRMKPNCDLDFIAPVLRWDIGHDIEFLNKNKVVEKFTANRITAGITLGFVGKIIGSEVRLNFEKYVLKNKTSDYARNPLLQDKVTIEIVAVF